MTISSIRLRAGAASRQEIIVTVLWLIVAFCGWLHLGPLWADAMRPPPNRINDFYQEWGSARNHLIGLPIYTDQAISIPRHLGFPADHLTDIKYNAHPPVAVLLALPLGHFDYPDAVFVWNLISMLALACGMKIVANTLALPWTALAPALALLALCHPVYGNLYMCQLNLLLVLLVTTAWALEQSGRSHRAGLIIGAAAAVKLFPIYLSVFYLARGRIWPLGAALLSFLALNFLAACVLGLDCYRDYVQIVIPEQAPFWGCGYNLSIAGFWHKLFNPLTENGLVAPLWLSPNLARWGTLVSDLAVTAIAAVLARRAETPFQRGMAFGTTVTAMLLVSPVTWDVSLPLLMVPIALILRGTEPPAARWIPTALVLILAIAWVPQKTLTMLALAGRSPGACSWQFMLGAPSLKFYGLLGIFALGLASFRAGGKN